MFVTASTQFKKFKDFGTCHLAVMGEKLCKEELEGHG